MGDACSGCGCVHLGACNPADREIMRIREIVELQATVQRLRDALHNVLPFAVWAREYGGIVGTEKENADVVISEARTALKDKP